MKRGTRKKRKSRAIHRAQATSVAASASSKTWLCNFFFPFRFSHTKQHTSIFSYLWVTCFLVVSRKVKLENASEKSAKILPLPTLPTLPTWPPNDQFIFLQEPPCLVLLVFSFGFSLFTTHLDSPSSTRFAVVTLYRAFGAMHKKNPKRERERKSSVRNCAFSCQWCSDFSSSSFWSSNLKWKQMRCVLVYATSFKGGRERESERYMDRWMDGIHWL